MNPQTIELLQRESDNLQVQIDNFKIKGIPGKVNSALTNRKALMDRTISEMKLMKKKLTFFFRMCVVLSIVSFFSLGFIGSIFAMFSN